MTSRKDTPVEKPDPRQQIERSGLFRQESFDWILEIIENNKDASYGSIDRKIRTSGELLSGEEILKLRLSANAKVSKRYYDALSDKGKEDILGSAFLTAQAILHAWSIFQQYEEIRRSTPNAEALYEAEIMLSHDGDDEGATACNAARTLQGKRFPLNEVPDLPLPACNADHCRCLFRYYRK